MISVARMYHIYPCPDDYGYCSEHSDENAAEALSWFMDEYGDEYERVSGRRLEDEFISIEHVGYTVYDGDEVYDFYL